MRNRYLAMLITVIFLSAMGSAALAGTMYQGRPAAYDSGGTAGYYIWQEGNRWYVQTANNGTQRLFTGMIETDGTFTDVSTLASERVERAAVDVRSQKIEFHFNSMAKNDGLSFTLLNSQNATLTLYIDGAPVSPASIFLGRQNRHPNSHSFNVNSLINDSYNNNSSINSDSPGLSRFQGQPTALNPGNTLGYFIWQEGNRWFLKTTTKGAQRQFTGNVRTGSTFANVNKNNLEENDVVRFNEAGNEISFNLKTESDLDGISFEINGNSDATFTLYLDGQVINPSSIYLGSQNIRPTTNPFSINASESQYSTNETRVLASDDQLISSADVQGQPAALNPGNNFGYFIWQEQNRWMLQTTTTGGERQFTGTIETDGLISDVNTMRSLRPDGAVVDAASNRINFTLKTGGAASGISISISDGIRLNQSDKLSGLSFLVSDGATLKFSLYADGQLIDPANIFLGNINRHPSSNALKIYSRNK